MSLKVNPVQGQILDVVKGSVATVTLFLAFVYFPVLGMIPGFFAPLPGAYYALKNDRKIGLLVLLTSSALLLGLADSTLLLVYLLQAGVLSLALPEFLLRLKGGARSIVYSVAINLLVMLVAALLYSWDTGADLHAKVTKGVQSSITQTALLYEKAGVKGDELKAMQESMQQAGELVITIYPALVTVSLGLVACMNLLVLARVANRVRMPLYVGDFKKYRNPEPLVWLLIASGFGMLAPSTPVYLASLNVLIVVAALYSVQGFAVISHYFCKLQVPKFIRLLSALFLIIQPFMVLAVAVLGVFDLWGDFRSPKKQ
ncbi:membrane protein DUF2232, putative [Citrifermentans bemidjiense Bem]|uniref:Membrane protein DUF2232, putative n=1 Tax=Citrifermentans bemidjiense (strain ATCC BAA-1014 / DSM 16622 / JCM 12645 / Bem) TaxID=404380 RepID=B5EHW7_CITBB|nr:membrane protein DUF2232, putative [Citrifermentans bemidjiense Bem]